MATYRMTSAHSAISDAVPRWVIAGLGVLVLLLLLSPNSVRAQASDTTAYWTHHIDAQVTELIESSDPALRADGMQLLIKLSEEREASIGFAATRAALYGVFFDHTYSEEQRIMALSALHAISGDQMTQALADEVDEVSSDRLRRHILLAVEQQI